MITIFLSRSYLCQDGQSFLFSNKKSNLRGQSARIWLEGKFTDWDSLSTLYSDTIGDQIYGVLDFGELKIANDERFLFLYIEIGEELNIQNDNQISLFLDTDNNENTGIQINGIGADVKWDFGDRQGLFFISSNSYTIYHEHIGIVTAPTVSSNIFEIAIDRTSTPFGYNLFPESSFKIVFHDAGPGQDMLPNSEETISYDFDETPLPPITKISLQRAPDTDFRVLTYNVLNNSIFEPSLYDTYDRILSAINPDIIGFQEIYYYTAQEVQALVESMLPSGPEEQWYCSLIYNDDVYAVSRFPILESYEINRSGAFLIDLSSQDNCQLLFIVAHLSSGNQNIERQLEIDELMAFIREAKEPGGVLELVENTPILISGDLNLVGYAQQLETLITGEIVNPQFGPSFSPDWDGSDFWDLTPRQTELLMYYTWFSESSSYSPGRLDFMIYSDYVLYSENSFVLFTPEMEADTLAAYGLFPDDVTNASDHLPVVSDFKILDTSSAMENSIQDNINYVINYPNPFKLTTTIYFSVTQSAVSGSDGFPFVNLEIYNIKGQKVRTFDLFPNRGLGTREVIWNGTDENNQPVGSGIYLYKLVVNNKTKAIKKMILLR
ncbi:MAG: T9SS type A sorting domain-containing protein [Candidatus Cloacimonetes bacterium]|nr:T9SS type A sorting domain-containing protein [Candidatus Cloacimonadota bacterium]